jgi:hypothetical protein
MTDRTVPGKHKGLNVIRTCDGCGKEERYTGTAYRPGIGERRASPRGKRSIRLTGIQVGREWRPVHLCPDCMLHPPTLTETGAADA